MACISIPTAMLIAGGVSAAAGVGSAIIGSNASHEAAQTQQAAAEKAADYTQVNYDEAKGNLTPFINMGTGAIGGLKNLLGLGPQGTSGIMTQLEGMPGYQFALGQGLQATQNGYAAKGLSQSGAALKGAADYSEGLAGTTYSTLFNNLFQTVGLGQNAASTLGQVGHAFTGDVNSLTTGGAAASAAGVVGGANAWTSGLTNAAQGISNALVTPAMLRSYGSLYDAPPAGGTTRGYW